MDRLSIIHPDMRVRASLYQKLHEEFAVDLNADAARALETHKARRAGLIVIALDDDIAPLEQILKATRAGNARMPLICLGPDNRSLEELAFRAGTDDYLALPHSPAVLAERIKSLLRRYRMAEQPRVAGEFSNASAPSQGVYVYGDLCLDPDRHDVTWKGKSIHMTVTEFKMLSDLARNPGIVKSRNRLMDASMDEGVYVDDRTIDSHLKRLRQKFQKVDSHFNYIETIYGVGYRFAELGRTPAFKPRKNGRKDPANTL
jgi:two-component system response regulator ChvI